LGRARVTITFDTYRPVLPKMQKAAAKLDWRLG
jgi:hypothetical protein